MISLKKLAETVTAPVAKFAKAVNAPAPPRESSDPFLNDNIRKRAINAEADRTRAGWIPRRPGWLRMGR